ncbi:Ig-like domain-containing protein, partial [Candidatus Bipolaricaulota bacterium]|nr:Ig-like domain-containing protein [Candidatus Bipolaricaulota bacterium]
SSIPIQVQNLNLGALSVTLESITVSPNFLNLLVGQTQQLTVTAQMSDGSSQDVTTQASYTSSNSSIASVSQSGQVTANSAGAATISVSYQGKTASVSVLVSVPVVIVEDLTVQPNPVSLSVGETQQLTVVARYSDGTAKDVTGSALYTSNNPSVAAVSAGGLVTGVAPGSTALAVAYGGRSAVVAVSVGAGGEAPVVVPPPPRGGSLPSVISPPPRPGLPVRGERPSGGVPAVLPAERLPAGSPQVVPAPSRAGGVGYGVVRPGRPGAS